LLLGGIGDAGAIEAQLLLQRRAVGFSWRVTKASERSRLERERVAAS